MHDYSAKYRGVVYFGLWAEERADRLGDQDAWNALIEACKECGERDVREDENYLAASAWFERGHANQIKLLRRALDVEDPAQRFHMTRATLHALRGKLAR